MLKNGKTPLQIIAVTAIAGVIVLVNQWSSQPSTGVSLYSNDQATLAFSQFIAKHGKGYLTKDEYNARLSLFRENFNYINDFNKNSGDGHKLEMNSFADWSDEERNRLLSIQPIDESEIDPSLYYSADDVTSLSAPTSIDWRTAGAVTPVKNQGACGSCYAFSSVGAIEGLYKINKGSLVEFSPQQIVDCTAGSTWGNNGCGSGLMSNVYNYLKSYKLQPMSSYPYTGMKQTCAYSEAKGVVKLSGYKMIAKNDAATLLTVVAQQPVSIGMDASSLTVFFYKSGIINSATCGTKLTHGVLVVGYGYDTASKQNYWIVKNSWGAQWGEQGYFRVLRTDKGDSGICGIYSAINSYPIL